MFEDRPKITFQKQIFGSHSMDSRHKTTLFSVFQHNNYPVTKNKHKSERVSVSFSLTKINSNIFLFFCYY